MRKIITICLIGANMAMAQAQTTYDSSTLVDTNNTSTSTSTVNTTNTSTSTSTATSNSTVNSTSTSTNTNNNVMSGSVTYNNNNVNTGTMTYNNNNTSTNTNYNYGDQTVRNINSSTVNSTANNTNYNYGDQTVRNVNSTTSNNTNVNTSTATQYNYGTMTNNVNNNNNSISKNENVNVNANVNSGDMTNRNINTSDITQRVITPPPTAIAPAMMSGGNNDLCTTGTSGSVQTQIFGVSTGGTVRDENCERLKLSKTLYDMGMKVAAVATMCQDRRVFDAMMAAGTPCPYEGKIGAEARSLWEANPDRIPVAEKAKSDDIYKKVGVGSLLGIVAYKLFNH